MSTKVISRSCLNPAIPFMHVCAFPRWISAYSATPSNALICLFHMLGIASYCFYTHGFMSQPLYGYQIRHQDTAVQRPLRRHKYAYVPPVVSSRNQSSLVLGINHIIDPACDGRTSCKVSSIIRSAVLGPRRALSPKRYLQQDISLLSCLPN
jgi:hypothetical protein